MDARFREFSELVRGALADHARRAGRGLPGAEALEELVRRLWAEVRGLEAVAGEVRELPDKAAEKRFEELAQFWAAELGDAALDARLLKQLLQGVAAPVFSRCRDSYLTGAPRRDPVRCAERLSGAHCVDCPLTVSATDVVAHRARLRSEWGGGPEEGDPAWESLLPGPWMRLRRWLAEGRKTA